MPTTAIAARDDGDLTGIEASAKDSMWGGQATIYFDPRDHLRWFATLSRGYKAGGFNLGEAAQVRPEFLPEYLVGLDVGMKGQWLEGRLYADVTAFYMKRTDMQVAISTQLDLGDPSSYLLYTDNASGGRNLGIESSVRWRATEQLELGGSARPAAYSLFGLPSRRRDGLERSRSGVCARVSSVGECHVASSAGLDGACRCDGDG